MATSSYIGIDVSKDRLDVAMLGEERLWQVDNTQEGITSLVEQMQKVCPELIVVEATGGYQRAVVEGMFVAGLAVAVVNPARETVCSCLWVAGQDRQTGCPGAGSVWAEMFTLIGDKKTKSTFLL